MPAGSENKIRNSIKLVERFFHLPSSWMRLWQVLIFSSLSFQIYIIPSAKAFELLSESMIADANLMHNLSKGWPGFNPDKGTADMYRQSWDYYLDSIRRKIPSSWKTGFKLSKKEGLFAGMPEQFMPAFERQVKQTIGEFSLQIYQNLRILEKESNHKILLDEDWENEKKEAQTNLRSSIESVRLFIEKLKVLSPDLSEMATRVALIEGVVPSWEDEKTQVPGEKIKSISVVDLLDQIPDQILRKDLLAMLPSQNFPTKGSGPGKQGKGGTPPVISQMKIDNSIPDTNPLCGLSKSSAVREAIDNFERGRASKSQLLISGDLSDPSGFNCRVVKLGIVRSPKDTSVGLDSESYVVFQDGRKIMLNNDDLKGLRESWNPIQSGDRIAQPTTVRRSSGAQ